MEAAGSRHVEDVVAGVWAEVLDRQDVGPDDDFFDLGGGSVHILRVMAELADQLGVDIDAELIFEAPTIRELSARLTSPRP